MRRTYTKTKLYFLLFAIVSFLYFGCSESRTDSTNTQTEILDNHLGSNLNAENQKVDNEITYEGDWLLTNSLFDSILTFKRIEESDSQTIYGKKFSFNADKLIYEHFNPVPTCGNGMFFMDTCSFNVENNIFRFNFKGGYMVESRFDYTAEYILSENSGKIMELERIATIHKITNRMFNEQQTNTVFRTY